MLQMLPRVETRRSREGGYELSVVWDCERPAVPLERIERAIRDNEARVPADHARVLYPSQLLNVFYIFGRQEQFLDYLIRLLPIGQLTQSLNNILGFIYGL